MRAWHCRFSWKTAPSVNESRQSLFQPQLCAMETRRSAGPFGNQMPLMSARKMDWEMGADSSHGCTGNAIVTAQANGSERAPEQITVIFVLQNLHTITYTYSSAGPWEQQWKAVVSEILNISHIQHSAIVDRKKNLKRDEGLMWGGIIRRNFIEKQTLLQKWS